MFNKGKVVGLAWFIGVPFVVLCDQLSKMWALAHLSSHTPLNVMPGVQCILAENRGMAFSLLDKQDGTTSTLLLGIIGALIVMLLVWLARTPLSQKISGIALVSILGGAIGNLCDRIWHGYVVDFIDFSIGSWHWYTFNIADSFITIGALMMIIEILVTPHRPSNVVVKE